LDFSYLISFVNIIIQK